MYNFLGELCISILALILMINMLISFSLKDKRNLLFFFCLLSVMIACIANIFSIHFITVFPNCNAAWAYFATTVYFLFIGIAPTVFTIYCYNFISATNSHLVLFKITMAVPLAVLSFVALANLKTGWLFSYDPVLGYTRGPLKNITYIISIVYAVAIICSTISNRKNIASRLFVVFLLYPLVNFFITAIQFFTTYYVMTGTSLFAALLFVYLNVQSDSAEFDLLTGLYIEKHLLQILSKKNEGVLTVISLENFKEIEDFYTTQEKNSVVLAIAKKLKSLYGRNVFFISNSKYALLTKNGDFVKSTLPAAISELETLKIDNIEINLNLIAVNVSIPDNAENYEKAMDVVNVMFGIARQSKNQKFVCCDETYISKLKKTKIIYEILERELNVDSKQFQVFFQPIHSVKDNKFIYAEALSRLVGTEVGNISPVDFISVAESKGLIERLGDVVFEKVCKLISENKDCIKSVSVNFSVHQMLNPNITQKIFDIIKKYDVEPERIIIEITESVFIENFAVIKERMNELTKAGFVFYLDDFGTGYSNFANVISLPFKTIKIDRSFVLMMEESHEIECLLNSLIHTFKESGLHILVEGVETLNQDLLVKNAGADFIQGFLYSKPVSEKEFISVMKQSI